MTDPDPGRCSDRADLLAGPAVGEALNEFARDLAAEEAALIAEELGLGHECRLEADGYLRWSAERRPGRCSDHPWLAWLTPAHLAALLALCRSHRRLVEELNERGWDSETRNFRD